jgi:hypothetical protein
MNFLFPIFKKDLLRLKWVLFCWLGLLCVQAFLGIGGTKFAADNYEFQIFLPQLSMLIRFMEGLMIIIIIPLLVQDDSLVGTTAFWFTRPMGGKQLLVTKVCFVASILVLAVVLAEIIVFVANGFLFRHIMLAIPEILIAEVSYIIPFFILAVITPKFSRYAIAGVIIYLILTMVSILWTFLLAFGSVLGLGSTFFSNTEALGNYTLSQSVQLVENIFIILVGSGLIVYQYRYRNTKKTVLWGVLGFLVLITLGRFWGIDFFKTDLPQPQADTVSDTVMFAIDADHISVSDATRYHKTDTREKTIAAQVEISSADPQKFAVLTYLKPEIMYSDNHSLDSSYVSTRFKRTHSDGLYMNALQAALAHSKLLNPFVARPESHEIFCCDETSFNQYKTIPGTYKASAKFDIYEYKISSTVPLKQGSRDRFNSEQVVIIDVLEQETGVSVIVGEKKAKLLFDRQSEKVSPYERITDSFSRSFYLIENKNNSEAFVAEDSGETMNIDELFNTSSRLVSKARRLDFVYINSRNGTLSKIDQKWLSDAQLIRVDAVRIGSVKKQIEFSNFVLPEKSTLQIPQDIEIELDNIQKDIDKNKEALDQKKK